MSITSYSKVGIVLIALAMLFASPSTKADMRAADVRVGDRFADFGRYAINLNKVTYIELKISFLLSCLSNKKGCKKLERRLNGNRHSKEGISKNFEVAEDNLEGLNEGSFSINAEIIIDGKNINTFGVGAIHKSLLGKDSKDWKITDDDLEKWEERLMETLDIYQRLIK